MSMASCFCQASARALFCSSVTGGSVSAIGSESHFCELGLTVFGTGTTRVTCAVPLASMKLELVWGTEAFSCAYEMAEIRMIAEARIELRSDKCGSRNVMDSGGSKVRLRDEWRK